jgi:ATP-dependent Lon protease
VSTTRLPVLFLTDLVVLPGMVVPIELDDSTRAAGGRGPLAQRRPAARRPPARGPLRLVRRRGVDRADGPAGHRAGRGRDPGRAPGADRRRRLRSGHRLWVEAEELDQPTPDSDEVRALAGEYKALVIATLQRREAWQVIDQVNQVTDPSTLADLAGYAPYLDDSQKRQLLETPDVAARLTVLLEWTRNYIAEAEVSDKIADDVR